MKTLTKIALSLFLFAFALLSFGQTMLTQTTLAAAITTGSIRTVLVSSATGFTAGTTSVYVDRELMSVTAVTSTMISVIRGQGGTQSAPHASGALVFVSSPNAFQTYDPQGSCTRTSVLYLPWINVKNGTISDCLGGQWVNGDGSQSTRLVLAINEPPTGGTAYSALETNGTAPAASTEQYCTQLSLPYNKALTGLGLLNGNSVAQGDKHIVILYDATGYLLGYSAVAGTTSAGASTYQQMAFLTPYYAVGPATYWGCIQSNGTTDPVRHVITGTNDNRLAGTLTGGTYGTIPAKITVPTTFTTAKGPYFQFY